MLEENNLLLDVETANDTIDALTYDISGLIIGQNMEIKKEFSLVVRDIFVEEKELMQQAYYASKIPEYWQDIWGKEKKLVSFTKANSIIWNLMKEYNIKNVYAYNCAFDKNALNKTIRYITKSQRRWFFPYETQFSCIWNMACQTICQTEEYKQFAEKHGFISNNGKNYRATAETVYAFLNQNPDFQEEHKGLDDCKIEYEILKEILNNYKELEDTGINRSCWRKVVRHA